MTGRAIRALDGAVPYAYYGRDTTTTYSSTHGCARVRVPFAYYHDKRNEKRRRRRRRSRLNNNKQYYNITEYGFVSILSRRAGNRCVECALFGAHARTRVTALPCISTGGLWNGENFGKQKSPGSVALPANQPPPRHPPPHQRRHEIFNIRLCYWNSLVGAEHDNTIFTVMPLSRRGAPEMHCVYAHVQRGLFRGVPAAIIYCTAL